jgi:hypothetical protein
MNIENGGKRRWDEMIEKKRTEEREDCKGRRGIEEGKEEEEENGR